MSAFPVEVCPEISHGSTNVSGFSEIRAGLARPWKRNWLLAALLGLCIFRLWLAPLPSSFWVDEAGTAFVVQHGAADPTLRVAPQVPESIYYFLPRIAQSLFGLSEISYRLPSVLAMLAALWVIAQIAKRLIHPECGWFAVFACLLLRDFNYQAADARPYALGTCVGCASLFFLIRWLDSGRWHDALAFGALATLVWRIHLLFWPVYVVFAVYTLVRLLRGDSRARWPHVILVYLSLGISLLPVAAEALALSRQAGEHVVASLPSGGDFTKALKLDFVMPFCVAAALFSRWLRWPRIREAASWESLTLVFSWWVGIPLCLFMLSRLTGNSVFVSRYMCLALPGAALAAAAASAAFLPARYWRRAAIALGVAVLLFLGHWNHLLPAHQNSDWRDAALAINAQASAATTPVVCPSPFIEARPPVWRQGYPVSSFLYSHLATYPVRGRIYPFPFETSPQAEQYASRLAGSALSASGKFMIYGGDTAVRFWRSWFSARPEFAGWRIRQLGAFGDVAVVVFQRPDPMQR